MRQSLSYMTVPSFLSHVGLHFRNPVSVPSFPFLLAQVQFIPRLKIRFRNVQDPLPQSRSLNSSQSMVRAIIIRSIFLCRVVSKIRNKTTQRNQYSNTSSQKARSAAKSVQKIKILQLKILQNGSRLQGTIISHT